MSQWSFVIAAYALVGIAVAALIGASYAAMRKAEAKAEAAKRPR
jgi:hypothetical protein